MNKEIEKALNNLWSSTTDVMFNVLYSQEEMQEDLKIVLNEFKNLYRSNEQNKNYIHQLENKVKGLEKENENWEKYNLKKEEEITQLDNRLFEAEAKAKRYDSLIKKIKEEIKNKEWATKGYDCTNANYKQSQAIGAWNILQKINHELLEEK